jgi:hypothetical protein
MRHIRITLTLLIPVLIAACGQSQADDLATRAALRPPTIALPTPASTPAPAVPNADTAIRIARGAVSPYLATWQDVVAMEHGGVWRVVFRNLEPFPPGASGADDYWRIPLSVFIDAQTGIVLRQAYI